MKVAVYGQIYPKNDGVYLQELIKGIKERATDIYVEERYLKVISRLFSIERKTFKTFNSSADLDESFDIFFSVGGDGTMLRAATYVRDHNIPIIGINMGRLGFLATIPKKNVRQAIQLLLAQQYRLVERHLIEIKTDPVIDEITQTPFALNEIAVVRRNTTSMITIAAFVNDEYLSSYWADGLIVATPTGSTGYSLSCGGPVITPDSDVFVITPIAPHNLNVRPLVIPANYKIKLQVSGREKKHLISMDSRIATADNETEIYLQKAAFTIKMIELTSESFLKTLRNKLLWGHDKRN